MLILSLRAYYKRGLLRLNKRFNNDTYRDQMFGVYYMCKNFNWSKQVQPFRLQLELWKPRSDRNYFCYI